MTTSEHPKHIFISYARMDGKEFAAHIDDDLQKVGHRTWRDLRSLNEYQDFSAEIETNIQQASHVVVCVTPSIDANPSSFVRREIIYAENKGIPIIPLVFPHATVPTLINHLTWIPFFDDVTKQLDYDSGLGQLLTRLGNTLEPPNSRRIEDPFRDYLTALYDQVVLYLKITVFSLLHLQSKETPDAVETTAKNVLPMAFWELAGVNDDLPEARHFSNFTDAFEAKDGRVLLLGEPGSGKTTTLFAFARDAIAKRLEDHTRPLPILVPITTWDTQTTPEMAKWITTTIPMLKQDEVRHLIDVGHTLLILDGLDELGHERPVDPRKPEGEMYDPRQRFLAHIPVNNQILITCRTKDFAEIGQRVNLNGAVTLQALNDAQMQEYLSELPDLWVALQADNDLRETARTPLILSLFTYAFRELPEEAKNLRDLHAEQVRDRIFESYVQRRYRHEERKLRAQGEEMPFTLEETYQMLGEVAADNLASWFSLENMMTVADIEQVLNDIDYSRFIEMVCNLQFMIRSQDGTLRFVHLLLRDYFITHYASTNVNHADANIRSRAAIVFGRLKTDKSLEVLIKMLNDSESVVRSSAALSLGNLGDARATIPLINLLSDTTQYFPLLSRRVCDVAARALTRIGTSEAVSAAQTWRKQQGKSTK